MSLENGSASSAERTIACPSWLALPRVSRSSTYADRGHSRHGFINALFSGTPMAQALAALPEADRETCRQIDWQKLCGDLEDIETEVAYAIDVKARTARRLGKNLGRHYPPLGPWEVPGTLDIQGRRRSDGVRVVVDVKSGWMDVTEAERNGQLLFFAAAFQLLEDRVVVDVRIAKLKGDGRVWNDAATFAAWEVDSYLDEYEGALERGKDAKRVYLAGGTPNFSEGPHCGYCEGADACPAKNQLARSMLSDLGVIEAQIAAMSDEEAGHAYEIAHDRIGPVFDRVLSGLKERARRRPLPLSGDRELREAPYDKTSTNAEALIELARELGADDAAIAKCQRKTTVRPLKPCKTASAKRVRRSA